MEFVTATMHHNTSRHCHGERWHLKSSREFVLELPLSVLTCFVSESSLRQKRVACCCRESPRSQCQQTPRACSERPEGPVQRHLSTPTSTVKLTLGSCLGRLVLSTAETTCRMVSVTRSSFCDVFRGDEADLATPKGDSQYFGTDGLNFGTKNQHFGMESLYSQSGNHE